MLSRISAKSLSCIPTTKRAFTCGVLNGIAHKKGCTCYQCSAGTCRGICTANCARCAVSRKTGSRAMFSTNEKGYEFITSEIKDNVGLITLNRPKALNALCEGLINEVLHAAKGYDAMDSVGAIVITGSEKAFAAGADIKEMSSKTYAECYTQNFLGNWNQISKISKPIIAAVSGYALGGGCELAMSCDIIIASENAKFGQPEITLGVIPGGGGTQRLIRAIGKSKAMEMILTGNMIDAHQAERDGLVCRVVPNEELLPAALKMGNKIASFSRPAVAMCKETVNAANELNLEEGLRFERRIFHSMFSLDDQKEGMKAFMEKRAANWTHK